MHDWDFLEVGKWILTLFCAYYMPFSAAKGICLVERYKKEKTEKVLRNAIALLSLSFILLIFILKIVFFIGIK